MSQRTLLGHSLVFLCSPRYCSPSCLLNFTLDIVLGYALYLLYPYQGGMGTRQTKMKVSRMASEIKLPREETGKVSQPDSNEEARATLALEGMTCASCAIRIEKGLKKV